MMNVTEIQKRVDNLSRAMLAKGLRQPSAEFQVESNVAPCIWLKWKDAARSDRYLEDNHYEKIEGDEPKALFDKADAFVAELPSAEEARTREFMGALGKVIDLGKSNGIEVEFLNPLRATMKKLSENALAYQPQAAE
jgi:hypothetical protein